MLTHLASCDGELDALIASHERKPAEACGNDVKKSSWDEIRKGAKKANEKVYILPDKADFVAMLGLIPSSLLFEKMTQRDEQRFEARNSRQLRSRRAAKILKC